MLLLIVEPAKGIGLQTRIQKMNDMNFIRPIVIGTQITSLTVVAKLTTMKVLLQCASTLLGMSLNPNSILRKRGMIRRGQEYQRFVAVRIMFDLIGLRMRRRNCWKMCASTTMVSLKFPLQDPLQAVATSSNNHTTIISSKLNCFIKQAGLFNVNPTGITLSCLRW